MAVSDLITQALKTVKSNAPEILTAIGISGVATTAYLAAKAGHEAASEKYAIAYVGEEPDKKQQFIDKAKMTWKLYIPAGLSGVATIACIVGSGRASNRRTTAAVAAYSLTEKAFGEYKEKVAEHIGAAKEQNVRDAIAQDRVNAKPPSGAVLMVGKNEVTCYEAYHDRYFKSDIETLRKAMNDVNYMISDINYVSMSEFYDILNLPHTQNSDNLGWDFEKQMELKFSYAGTPDGEPCLAFEYNYVKPLR